IAVRLSYALWNTTPDGPLMDAASGGGLRTAADVVAQARRMMADARGQAGLRSFVEGWFGLADVQTAAKDARMFPYWNAQLGGGVLAGSGAVVESVFAGDGRLATFLTTSRVPVNKQVSSYYPGTAAGESFQPIEGPKGQVAGLLTSPAFLAA